MRRVPWAAMKDHRGNPAPFGILVGARRPCSSGRAHPQAGALRPEGGALN
jgi:hypothetical protein